MCDIIHVGVTRIVPQRFKDNLVFFKSFPAEAEIRPLIFFIKKVMCGGVKPGAVCAPPTDGARSLATPQRAAYPPAPPHMAEPPCPSPLAYCRKSYHPMVGGIGEASSMFVTTTEELESQHGRALRVIMYAPPTST